MIKTVCRCSWAGTDPLYCAYHDDEWGVPEWDSRASLESVCGSDAKTRAALAEIDALRYAEEHAVRYEAVGLAPQRRRVQALYETLFASDGLPSPALP